MNLPAGIIKVLIEFQPAFSVPSYRKVMRLVIGTLLGKGERTVTAALRQMGIQDRGDWAKYHHLLNRAKWSAEQVGQILLRLLVRTFVSQEEWVKIVLDETLERRSGKRIKKRGHWRDSRASSKKMNVSSSGLRWLVGGVVVKLGWSQRRWALPFLSTLLLTPKVSEQLGKRHKKLPQVAGQMISWLRRTLPDQRIKVIGDGSYSVIELGLTAQKRKVTLIAPLRLDARLFDPPPPYSGRGRPRVVGARLPNLAQIADDPHTQWQRQQIDWYGGQKRLIDWVSGTAMWYSTGIPPLPLRWVLVRDPSGQLATKAYFSTDQDQDPLSIITDFVDRWSIEVTFEESRAHLGVETQRQWADLAIERTTPALFGLFSLVVLFAHTLFPDGQIPIAQSAWYAKSEATFSDVIAAVRRALWGNFIFQTAPDQPDMLLIPRRFLDRLAFAVCH